MKILFFICGFMVLSMALFAQVEISGKVYDRNTQTPIAGLRVQFVKAQRMIGTDEKGYFKMTLQAADTLYLDHIGYVPYHTVVDHNSRFLEIGLEAQTQSIDLVEVNTGYYRVAKERSPGSFVHIDSMLLNRSPSPNILQRLEGLAPGLQFVNAGGADAQDIRIRGLGTIESDERPLIVLDGFPYEGDINNIPPNTIESVTLLMDAAAASIWGARAGNGVIVITTKKNSREQPIRISVHTDAGITDRPDITYSPEWLPAEKVMAIEKQRYALGHYNYADNVTIPYYVELLRANADGDLTDGELAGLEHQLKSVNAREEIMEHLYSPALTLQHGINMLGGSQRYGFSLSASYLDQQGSVSRNGNKRYNLSFRNRFRPITALEIDLGLSYVNQQVRNNGISYDDLSVVNIGVSPYMGLQDENGRALPLLRNALSHNYTARALSLGLLDWEYRPLDELRTGDNRSFSQELRVYSTVNLTLPWGIYAKADYQYTGDVAGSRSLYTKDSYYVRNMVNRFTQPNGTRIIPQNGILYIGSPSEAFSHYGRMSVGFDSPWESAHRLHAIGGFEVRHHQTETFPSNLLYNYDEEYQIGDTRYNYNQSYTVRPLGNSFITGPAAVHRLLRNRDVSYFGNLGYNYLQRYFLSGSLRYDASNLFGVKTNQKGVPLWSLGGSWDISRERFFNVPNIDFLRIRATYGIAGNVNKSVTHFPTATYSTSNIGLRNATYRTFGNPSLRWEKVATENLGLDFRVLNGRLSGSLEFYGKKGSDLIGNDLMDPTTGVSTDYKINYADIATRGIDLQLTGRILTGKVGWNTVWIGSQVSNKVTNYYTKDATGIGVYLTDSPNPVKNSSRDLVYALPWSGLSSENGYPFVEMDGVKSQQYAEFYDRYMDFDKLLKVGVRVPTYYGSIRNTFDYKDIELGFLITWKAGYVFRRTSMYPGAEYAAYYHEDYDRRWQSPGDERSTDVPAFIAKEDMPVGHNYLSTLYLQSEALVSSGSHIRLHDINIGYSLPASLVHRLNMKGIRVKLYCRNLGVIWRENKVGIDPDYARSLYVEPRFYSFGLTGDF